METNSFLLLPPSAAPAPGPSTPTPYPYPPIIIILTIILLVFFVGFFSIYFSRYFLDHIPCTWHFWQSSSAAAPASGDPAAPPLGLDPSIVHSFPSFPYSTVKEYRKEKYGLECAICLVEFQATDLLRLLTTCYHVFHQECIDLWLESHKTCPVCRRNLESRAQSPAKSPDSFRITIDNEEDEDKSSMVSCEEKVAEGLETSDEDGHGQRDVEANGSRFSRSHSTGHSVNGEIREGDRYTLILPEHVIRGCHNPSQSWPTFGEEFRAHESNTNAEVSGVQKSV